MKFDLPKLLQEARTSSWKRWWMNLALRRAIPFNRPHGFRVEPLADGGISVRIPHWRINQNHIRGTHACAMATGAEMCSGLSLLEHLSPKEYRLIMASLHMEYHYQAKKDAVAVSVPSSEQLDAVRNDLLQQDSTNFISEVKVEDVEGKHLATGTITWQVKEWSKVRTKV